MIRNSRRPSEDYLETGNDWCTLDQVARLLEENKTAVFAQRCNVLGDMPVNRAEQIVRASQEWADYIKKMVEAKTAANRARVRLKYYEMKHMEAQSDAANERTETRLRA